MVQFGDDATPSKPTLEKFSEQESVLMHLRYKEIHGDRTKDPGWVCSEAEIQLISKGHLFLLNHLSAGTNALMDFQSLVQRRGKTIFVCVGSGILQECGKKERRGQYGFCALTGLF